jgi:hypothetical protein
MIVLPAELGLVIIAGRQEHLVRLTPCMTLGALAVLVTRNPEYRSNKRA